MQNLDSQKALTALQKVFGVTVTSVVTFLTGLIMSAVLSSQKLAEHIKTAIVEYHDALPAPTTPTISDGDRQLIVDEAIARATEVASSGTMAAIGQQLTAALADPTTVKQLVTAIVGNPEALNVLQTVIYKASETSEKVKGSAKDRLSSLDEFAGKDDSNEKR